MEILRLNSTTSENVSAIHEMMERQLTHMVRLIDDLHDVSRIARNKLELKQTLVSLKDIVSSAVEIVRPALAAANQNLKVDLPKATVQLWGDFTRLTQVFGNLLSNSVKYTAQEGSILLSASLNDEQVAVVVRDTGIGIPKEALPHIFNMFSQVDRSLERSIGGLG